MDLGRINEGPEGMPAAPSQTDRPEFRYPNFTLNDELVEKFMDEHECEMQDEITATVTLKVTGMRDDEYGKSLSFDILTLDVEGEPEKGEEAESAPEEEPAKDEKPKGHRNPAIAKLIAGEKS